MSEETLVRQAAPTLAGVKTGSMFTCECDDRAALLTQLRELNRRLTPKGLCLLPLRFQNGRVLLYLYRPAQLKRDLADTHASEILTQAGYPAGGSSRQIAQLIRRFQTQKAVPHEVGLFLSYPPEDVRGFIENGARDCKCAGLWKVYGDPQKAEKLFAKFKKCTKIYCALWQAGTDIDRLAVAV